MGRVARGSGPFSDDTAGHSPPTTGPALPEHWAKTPPARLRALMWAPSASSFPPIVRRPALWLGGVSVRPRRHTPTHAMPKQKTNSAAKKRFKLTGTGRVKRKKAFTSHILTKKSPKRKRNLRGTTLVDRADEPRVKRLLNV